MGGNAFKKVVTRRFLRAEYKQIEAEIIAIISPIFRLWFVPPYADDKESFGDLDILLGIDEEAATTTKDLLLERTCSCNDASPTFETSPSTTSKRTSTSCTRSRKSNEQQNQHHHKEPSSSTIITSTPKNDKTNAIILEEEDKVEKQVLVSSEGDPPQDNYKNIDSDRRDGDAMLNIFKSSPNINKTISTTSSPPNSSTTSSPAAPSLLKRTVSNTKLRATYKTVYEHLPQILNSKEVVKSGHVISCEYKEFQIDFILTKAEKFDLNRFFLGNGDFGMIIGNICTMNGLKFGSEGLAANVYEPSALQLKMNSKNIKSMNGRTSSCSCAPQSASGERESKHRDEPEDYHDVEDRTSITKNGPDEEREVTGARVEMRKSELAPSVNKTVDTTRSPNVIGKIHFSHDLEEIASFLGLDLERWREGFTSQADVYEYILSCRLFYPEAFRYCFLAEGQNQDNRVRIRRRPGYRGFLELVRDRFFPDIPVCWQQQAAGASGGTLFAENGVQGDGNYKFGVQDDGKFAVKKAGLSNSERKKMKVAQQKAFVSKQTKMSDEKQDDAESSLQKENLPKSGSSVEMRQETEMSADVAEFGDVGHKFYRTNFDHFFEALNFFHKKQEYETLVANNERRERAKIKFNGKVVQSILRRLESVNNKGSASSFSARPEPSNGEIATDKRGIVDDVKQSASAASAKAAGVKLGMFIRKFKEAMCTRLVGEEGLTAASLTVAFEQWLCDTTENDIQEEIVNFYESHWSEL